MTQESLKIDGFVETNLPVEEFMDKFIEWVESLGCFFGGVISPVDAEGNPLIKGSCIELSVLEQKLKGMLKAAKDDYKKPFQEKDELSYSYGKISAFVDALSLLKEEEKEETKDMDLVIQFAKLWGMETADARTDKKRYQQLEGYDSVELLQLLNEWETEYLADENADDSVEFFYNKFNKLIEN